VKMPGMMNAGLPIDRGVLSGENEAAG